MDPQQVIAEVHPLVVQIVRGRTLRPEDVDDLSQDVMVRIIEQLPTWRGDAPITHWAARIAVNLCIDHGRRLRRLPGAPAAPEAVDPAGHPDDAVAARDLVDRLLAGLSAKDRLVVHLLDIEGWSIPEVAVRTGWSRLAIRLRVHRARKRLRQSALTLSGDPVHARS
jgi:RNA polymerase sigma-70 factor (ECF subfamily)